MKKIEISKKEFKTIDDAVSEAVKLIKKGYQKKQVLERVRKAKIKVLDAEDIYIAAKMRIKSKEKFGDLSLKLFFDESGYRYSTPAIVAEYRAKRLKDKNVAEVADVSCGVGMQLIFFDKVIEEVEGVELCKKRAYLAALNVKAVKAKCKVYHGDAFEFKTKAEVVFSDPARPESEKVRVVESLQPNPLKLIEHFRGKTFVFELPPQMPPERIDRYFSNFNFERIEKEYTSLHFKLNRLALYTDNLADCEELSTSLTSAVSLPSEEKVTSDDEKLNLEETEKIKEYIAEVDRTIVHSKLLENLAGKLKLEAEILELNPRRTLITSEKVFSSSFLRYYQVEETCKFELESLRRKLREVGARKVTLRFKIDPKEYWNVRKKLEEELNGEKHIYLFKTGEKAILASPIT